MARRIFLHVGNPKTGTTFLQTVLFSSRETARDQGLLLPLGEFNDHYLACIDLRGLSAQPQFPPRAVGMWDRMVEETRAWPGDVLITHELFAAATAEEAERGVRSFTGAEVHVIVTARDLVRQIPAEWQEHVKHRAMLTFPQFVAELQDGSRTWFWNVQDTADVCRRWGAALPPSSTTVVTVPQSGGPQVLWERFSTALDLPDPSAFDLSVRSNPSLHAEQTELLRRVNVALGPRLPRPGPYPRTVKEVFAQKVLINRPGTAVVLTPADREFAVRRSTEMAKELRELGVGVVGDLDDLVPSEEAAVDGPTTVAPETSPPDVLLEESVAALAELLVRFDGMRERAQTAERERDRLRRNIAARSARQLLIRMSERWPAVMRLRVLYWRAQDARRSVRARLSRIGSLGRKSATPAEDE